MGISWDMLGSTAQLQFFPHTPLYWDANNIYPLHAGECFSSSSWLVVFLRFSTRCGTCSWHWCNKSQRPWHRSAQCDWLGSAQWRLLVQLWMCQQKCHPGGFLIIIYCRLISKTYMVVDLPLWKIWKSVGMIIPNLWKNRKCSKPPTIYIYIYLCIYIYLFIYIFEYILIL